MSLETREFIESEVPSRRSSTFSSKPRKGSKRITRSRNGCHNCKRLKIKCDEKKPNCSYCQKTNADCDYSLKLTWGGRNYKNSRIEKSYKDSSSRTNLNSGDIFISHRKSEPKRRSRFINSTISDRNHGSTLSGLENVLIRHGSSLSSEAQNVQDSTPVSLPVSPKPQDDVTDDSSSVGSLNLIKQSTGLNQFLPQNIKVRKENAKSLSTHDGFADNFFHEKFQQLDPNIIDGIQSVDDAISNISTETNVFSLQNSSIFKNFMLARLDRNSSAIAPSITNSSFGNGMQGSHNDLNIDGSGNENSVLEEFDDYARDIAYIDAFEGRTGLNSISRDIPTTWDVDTQPANGSNSGDKESADDLRNTSKSLIRYSETYSPSSECGGQSLEGDLQKIPASLTPLPEALLHVPYYRNLMHFWVEVASASLVPAPTHLYKYNPFKIILPQIAMVYPSVLMTLLAFSSNMRSLLLGEEVPEQVVNHLLSRSCNALVKQLQDTDDATSDGTLASVLLLSCYEQYNSNHMERHRVHNLGARQILKARYTFDGSSQPKSKKRSSGFESDIFFFLIRWFVYIDVLGAISSTKDSYHYLAIDDESEYSLAALLTRLSNLRSNDNQRSNGKIDYFLGFDAELLPQFIQVALMIRKVDQHLIRRSNANSVPIEITAKALEVRDALLKSAEKQIQSPIHEIATPELKSFSSSPQGIHGNINTRNGKPALEDNQLFYSNKLFCYMAVINLYRRVLKIPRESIIVQSLARDISDVTKVYACSSLPGENCFIFVLFCAGCETLDEELRSFFQERLTKLSFMGNRNASKSLEIMKYCWKTGHDWTVASRHLDLDIALI